jgi:CheY-like chemotaxis protein
VLLIDDEPDTLSVFCMLLEMSGYRVVTALDGDEALQRIASTRPDVVVTDWMMPGMNGHALCAELRKEGSDWSSVPIIVASAAMQPPEGAERLYDRFVRKPLLIDDLLREIEGVLRERRISSTEEIGSSGADLPSETT